MANVSYEFIPPNVIKVDLGQFILGSIQIRCNANADYQQQVSCVIQGEGIDDTIVFQGNGQNNTPMPYGDGAYVYNDPGPYPQGTIMTATFKFYDNNPNTPPDSQFIPIIDVNATQSDIPGISRVSFGSCDSGTPDTCGHDNSILIVSGRGA